MVDQEITIQTPEVRENEANAKRKIAIVGAGPAGLSCGYFLARLGYRPTVFESEPRPGGMLVQTIPAYRLPREILAREIRMIEGLGVELRTNRKLGEDFTLQSLREDGYDAVFVATGAPKGITLDLPGSDAEGVTEAIEFLREYNLRGSAPVCKRVAVIGGGNAAIDAARTAVRLGAEVTVIYRRTQEEMPAYAEEIEEAQQEGVTIRTLVNPVEILTDGGKVSGVRCKAMRLGDFDRSGRRRPEESEEETVIAVDQVIFACGQTADCGAMTSDVDVELADPSRIWVDPLTGQTSIPWVFAGGDVANEREHWSVVEAIAGGERAAAGIDEFLTGENHAFWRGNTVVDTAFDPDDDPVPYPRSKLVLLSVDRRRNNFDEVEHAWTEGEAVRQARRCLRCDYGKCVDQ
jgi:NADH-quinone oxidoreductase subunit F